MYESIWEEQRLGTVHAGHLHCVASYHLFLRNEFSVCHYEQLLERVVFEAHQHCYQHQWYNSEP